MEYRSFFMVVFACVLSLKATAAETTEWELWLPSNNMPVKTVFVAPRWGDGANMVKLIQKNLSEKLGIATMLTREDKNTFRKDHFLTSIPDTLSTSAVAPKRPELAHAPLLLWSHSNAAAYVQRCLKDIPERVIAYCLFKSAYGHNNDLGTMSRAATQAFGQTIWAERRPVRDEDRAGRDGGAGPGRRGMSSGGMNRNRRVNGGGHQCRH